jgi:hypothetical protein
VSSFITWENFQTPWLQSIQPLMQDCFRLPRMENAIFRATTNIPIAIQTAMGRSQM